MAKLYDLGGQEFLNPEAPINNIVPVVSLVESIQPLPDFSDIVSVTTSLTTVDTVTINGSALFRGISIVPIGLGISVIVTIQAGSQTYTIPTRAGQGKTAGKPVGLSTILNIQYEHPYIILLPQGSTITVKAIAATSAGQGIQIFYDIINNTGVS